MRCIEFKFVLVDIYNYICFLANIDIFTILYIHTYYFQSIYNMVHVVFCEVFLFSWTR